MAALRWMFLLVLFVANLWVAAWWLGWAAWMPFPHETPREPDRVNDQLRAGSLTVLSPPPGPAGAIQATGQDAAHGAVNGGVNGASNSAPSPDSQRP